MTRPRRSLLHRWANASVLVVGAAILLLTLSPLGTTPGAWWNAACTHSSPCPIGHAGLFALLGAALAAHYATSEAARRSPSRVLGMVLLSIWIFAALDELAQRNVGGATQLYNWLADILGGLLGLFGSSLVLRLFLRSRR